MADKEYIIKLTTIQQDLLNYIDDSNEIDFNQLVKSMSKLNINKSRDELKSFLQLICAIVNNHHRLPDFFEKIERILLYILPNIKQKFTGKELVRLFYSSRILLLFFLEQKLLEITDLPQGEAFRAYFYPELEETLNNDEKDKYLNVFKDFNIEYKKEIFTANRKKGENESYICSLMREDLVEEFISYVNRSNISLSSQIPISLFESNQFLNGKNCGLIEYSAFFGSIQIFNYLHFNKVPLTPSLWLFTIHGNNADLIHLLEENKVGNEEIERFNVSHEMFHEYNSYTPERTEKLTSDMINLSLYGKYLAESIKCHHNDIANYIKNKILEICSIDKHFDRYIDNFVLIKNEIQTDFENYVLRGEFGVGFMDFINHHFAQNLNIDENVGETVSDSIFSSYNYFCFPDKIGKERYLAFLCEYDYDHLFELLVKIMNFDVNKEIKIPFKKFFNAV